MKIFKLIALCTLLALLLVPAAVFAQEQAAPARGVIEFGFRGVAGDVYGREPGMPGTQFANGFRPDLLQSPLNTYSDYRNAFYIPKVNIQLDSLFGSNNYLNFQSKSNGFAFEGGGTLQRDQSALVTFGQYGHYKLQFRYDQTPHIFSGTTRTLFSNSAGVWGVNPTLQSALFSTLCGSVRTTGTSAGTCTKSGSSAPLLSTIAGTINNAVSGSLVAGVPGVQPFAQQENRKAITGSMGWNITPDVNVSALVSREHQVGTRPIGFVLGNSSGGYAAESPESLNYYTDNVRVAGEFGRKSWNALLGYQGSFFHNGTPSMVVTNPFSTVYDGAYTNVSGGIPGIATTGMGPATGRMDLYPDNQYHQLVSQGAVELGKHVNFMANVTPGFLRQNAQFQPLTTNTAINLSAPAGYPDALPTPSLKGQVDTLAMNYTAVLKATKSFKVVAKYQHYSYNDNTPDWLIRPVIADTAWMSFREGPEFPWVDPGSSKYYYFQTERSSFTNKLFDVGGTWFFAKKNSVKFGYQRGWVDRINREAAESIEDSIYGALDMRLHKTVSLRVSGRHQNRVPQEYESQASDFYSRMPDQSTRLRNRGDVSLSWDPTDRLSISGFFGTLQDNFNQRGGVNSPLPLGDPSLSPLCSPLIAGCPTVATGKQPTPIYGPYYAYGVLNSIGRNYGAAVNYALTSKVVLFAEYAREKNTGVIIEGRGFNPGSVCTRTFIPVTSRDANGVLYSPPAGGNRAKDCDPINDLYNASKDVVNSYYGGVDFTTKKADLSLYYSLSAGQSFLFAEGVNCQVGSNGPNPSCGQTFANWKLDYLTNVSGGVASTYYAYGVPAAGGFGFPPTVSRIHDVGVIARFKLSDRVMPKIQYIFRQNDYTDWQTGIVNPYNFVGAPYSYAGTATDPAGGTSLQKMLFLGADNPSYRAHIFSATLEYHF